MFSSASTALEILYKNKLYTNAKSKDGWVRQKGLSIKKACRKSWRVNKNWKKLNKTFWFHF